MQKTWYRYIQVNHILFSMIRIVNTVLKITQLIIYENFLIFLNNMTFS